MTEAQRARLTIRRDLWQGNTAGKVPGFVQCNLVVLAEADACDFLVYCHRNPQACPLIDVTDPGDPVPRLAAPDADVRTDVSCYAIYRRGERCEDVTDIRDLWRPDSVAFLLGSSLSFEYLLAEAGVWEGAGAWVLNTTIPTTPAGRFRGNMVVTMRLMTRAQADQAAQITHHYPKLHGGPIHIGRPEAIGADLVHPIAGESLAKLPEGLVGVFWPCGVTPQAAAVHAQCELFIAQTSGHGFISDLKPSQFYV